MTMALSGTGDIIVVGSSADSPSQTPDTITGFVLGSDTLDLSTSSGSAVAMIRNANGSTSLYFGVGGQLNVFGTIDPADVKLAAGAYLYFQDASASETVTAGNGLEYLHTGGTSPGGDVFDLTKATSGVHDIAIDAATDSPLSNPDSIKGFVSGTDVLDLSQSSGGDIFIGYGSNGSITIYTANGGQITSTSLIQASDIAVAPGAYAYIQGGSASQTFVAGNGLEYLHTGGTSPGGDVFDLTKATIGVHDIAIDAATDSPLSNPDSIKGFVSGTDVLDLSALQGSSAVLSYTGSGSEQLQFVNSSGATTQVNIAGNIQAGDLRLPSSTSLSIQGTNGSDTIVAANGNETLNGEGGGDVFDLSRVSTGQHTISAFTANGSADVLRLSSALFPHGYSDVTTAAQQQSGGVYISLGNNASVLLAGDSLSHLAKGQFSFT